MLRPIVELRTGEEQIWQMPECCPVCGEPVVQPDGEVAYYCTNSACAAQLVRSVEHFVSRGAMDVEGFGIRQAELFVERGLITDLADIYTLPWDEIKALEGFGEKRVAKLQAAVEVSKQQPLARLLTALGIRGVGSTVAEALAEHFGSLENLMAAPAEEVEGISGIGPKLAASCHRLVQPCAQSARRGQAGRRGCTAGRRSGCRAGYRKPAAGWSDLGRYRARCRH